MGGSETIINKGFHYESIFEINSKGELIWVIQILKKTLWTLWML